jgi:hypothetical protein
MCVKAKLVELARQESRGVRAQELKLVFSGRALEDDETLQSLLDLPSSSGRAEGGQPSLTLHALLVPSAECKAAASPSSTTSSASASAPCSPHRLFPRHSAAAASSTSAPPTPGGHADSGRGPAQSPASQEFLESLKKQVTANMRKAFFDLIEQALAATPPDHEWITRLYGEMRDRLCALTPRRSDLHREIHEVLDVDVFEQMVVKQAFDLAHLSKLVAFVFARLARLCAPVRDGEVAQRHEQLNALLSQQGTTFAQFAVVFLQHFHTTIDDLESDLQAFKGQMRSSPSVSPGRSVGNSDKDAGLSPEKGGRGGGGESPVKDLKARLRQLGVAEEKIHMCSEKKELESLLVQASARALGTVSGGVMHLPWAHTHTHTHIHTPTHTHTHTQVE